MQIITVDGASFPRAKAIAHKIERKYYSGK